MIWISGSLKISTPRDVPSHLFENPDHYSIFEMVVEEY